MSPDVTEPNSLPSSPTRAAKVREIGSILAANSSAAVRRAFSAASSVAFSWAMRFLLPGVAS